LHKAFQRVLGSCFVALLVCSAPPAWGQAAPPAQPDANAQKEATIHFSRAVELYNEADYRGALVEFKRAYDIAPNTTVLYNLGQTHYQLQNYAAAMNEFDRYLAEGATAHRSEVESTLAVLRTRVGKIDVSTQSPGWEIAVDDEPIGKTPIYKPIIVSVGRRKITATRPGEPVVVRTVEIAAGEYVPVMMQGTGGAAAAPPPSTGAAPPPAQPEEPKRNGTLLTVGWIGTGALVAGTAITGILALDAASKLKDARNTFPADRSDLDSKASTTNTLGIVTDVLGASAIVLGGVTLYFTLTSPSSPAPAKVGIGARGNKLVFEGTF
jgi:hypothetical protein